MHHGGGKADILLLLLPILHFPWRLTEGLEPFISQLEFPWLLGSGNSSGAAAYLAAPEFGVPQAFPGEQCSQWRLGCTLYAAFACPLPGACPHLEHLPRQAGCLMLPAPCLPCCRPLLTSAMPACRWSGWSWAWEAYLGLAKQNLRAACRSISAMHGGGQGEAGVGGCLQIEHHPLMPATTTCPPCFMHFAAAAACTILPDAPDVPINIYSLFIRNRPSRPKLKTEK